MENDLTPVGGVAVRGEHIVAVGGAELVLRYRGDRTRVVELGDTALLPGFVDAHGHFSATARLSDFVNLSSPPVGAAENIDDIVKLLQQRIAATEMPAGGWVLGYGYDDSLLAEKRHPTRDDLDAVSTEHPILLMHVSGHFAATNSLALRQLEIDADTPDPQGGVIRRREGSREPNGVFEESAASALLFGQLSQLTGDRFVELTRDAATQYASYGITTVQDGAIIPGDLQMLRDAAAAEPYIVDIGTYTYVTALSKEGYRDFVSEPDYVGGIRQVGVKFSLDGSPQGRTAWMTEPYAAGPPGATADYVAYPTTDPEYYITRVADMIRRDIPVLVHANGDAAIDLMIDGVAAALEVSPKENHRSVIIHAQLMRNDQLKRAAELGIVASFFSAHPFFWGDWHRLSFGDRRAQNISPTRWAIDNGVKFTLHNDAPVVPPDMMRLLWVTVNRTTRSGYVLGPEQRLTVPEALHAITLGSAYQFFEEERKGSIRVGKQADLVILDANPLQVDPAKLKDIQVVETISRGRSVYRNAEFVAQ
jgi:predicted amidohydrolase YtcJ